MTVRGWRFDRPGTDHLASPGCGQASGAAWAADVRTVAGWITGPSSNLEPEDAERLQAIRTRRPELDATVRHGAGFARMMIEDLSGDENTLAE